MKFVTSKALDLVMQNYNLFLDGIDIDNLPIGLAYKDHVLFASDQRRASMPIDEFTVKTNIIKSHISNPLEYTWLPFAIRGSISLNDIYGSDLAPRVYGEDEHPIIKEYRLNDLILDIPFNSYHMRYNCREGESSPRILLVNSGYLLPEDVQENKRLFFDKFPGIYFYEPSPIDLQKLNEIYENLQKRGVEKVFGEIIRNNHVTDGGFLLEEGVSLFLKKLFQEILPLSDHKKQEFFKKVLADHKFKSNSSLEDVFEGLDGFYKKLHEFMIGNEIAAVFQEKIVAKSMSIIKKQMVHGNGFKVLLGRFVNILQLVLSNGGNIEEQMEYLDSREGDSILKDSGQYRKAKELGLNVIHSELILIPNESTSDAKEDLSADILVKAISDKDYLLDFDATIEYKLLTNTLRYLATIPAYQRPSISTYSDYFYKLDDLSMHASGALRDSAFYDRNAQSLFDGYIKRKALKVREYVLFDEIPYQYEMEKDIAPIWAIYKSDLDLSELRLTELSEKYILCVAGDDGLYIQIKAGNFLKRIEFSKNEVSQEIIESIGRSIKQHTNNEVRVARLTVNKLNEIFQQILAQLLDKMQSDPEMMSVLMDLFGGNESEIHSDLYIKPENNSYDLYLKDKNENQIKLDKSSLILPAVFEEIVRKCVADGPLCSDIRLLPNEIKGTVFESFPHHFIDEYWFKSKNYKEKVELLNRAPKEKIQHSCYAAVGIVVPDANLVTNFTTKQAAENVKLLALNILSSTGEHYDRLYPDQEFTSYVSLFNTLFSEVKVYNDLESSLGFYNIIDDYNRASSFVRQEHRFSNGDIDIKNKEEKHKRLVESFVNIYKKNPIFNFTQIVVLGLIDNLGNNLTDEIIKKAKILLGYNGYFTQMLRVLLSTPTVANNSVASGFDELSARTRSIIRVIDHLFKPISYQGKDCLVHELLTENGKHPENLPIFAACFGQEPEINGDNITIFLAKLTALDPSLKEQLINGFATTQLPYAKGEIIANNFPIITLDDLDHPDIISNKIALAKNSAISYADKTKFNDASMQVMEHSKINFSPLEDKYNLSLTNDLKSKQFGDIKKDIISDNNFVKKNFIKELKEQEITQKIHFDVAIAIFSVFSQPNLGWKSEAQKIITFLFNPVKKLEEQFLEIDSNYRLLLTLLSKCNDSEKEDLLDYLLEEPKIPHHLQNKILNYLNSLDKAALQAKNYTLPMIIKSAGNKIIGQNFDAFTIATDRFIQSDLKITLEALYRFIENLADAKYSSANIKIITAYCLECGNYSIIPVLATLDGKADNIDELVDWMTHIILEDIEKLNDILGANFKAVLTIRDIRKIKVMMDVALRLNDTVSKERYTELAKQIMKNDINYATLVSSYLQNGEIKGLPQKDRLDIGFNNINQPAESQVIFSQYNLERFNYDLVRIKEKIEGVLDKNGAHGEVSKEEQDKLYNLFIKVMEKARTYSTLTVNEIRVKAIELKRQRTLAKKNITKLESIDIDYLALSFEALYRTTNKFPRDTQIISVLLSVTNSNHIIEEIATGQGKSLIAALQAAYLCFTGQTVDVVTSSQDLAKKDRQEFAPFYQSLGLTIARSIITAASEIAAYEKGGINYAVASDLALFRANREFYSNTMDLELNTDVSLIGDEVDFILTSGINYKLAAALVKTTQEEARVLFNYIIDFSNTEIFQNGTVASEDDIKNLKMYLDYQFQQYDSSYRYPLSIIQADDLRRSKDPRAPKLYALHRSLSKANKNMDQLFDKLLSAVIVAKKLVKGVDYVILKEEKDKDALLQATPIIKDQPSKGTVFGDGAQSFLHLLIERQQPELEGRFDISIPSSTIFNVSPKNFIDYYRLTGGKIIGMTGTAGSKEEIGEFKEKNRLLTFNIPRYEEDIKVIKTEEAENKDAQYRRVHAILDSLPVDRPVIIFAQNTKEAEQVYAEIVHHRERTQLYAISPNDTTTLKEILNNAGKNGCLTVTTPMLGRGTNFYTTHVNGFLAINLCTDITESTLLQIYGRVARNGHPGEVISLFDRELFGESMEAHMKKLSEDERQERMKSQPLTDVLQYFNHVNQNSQVNAIKCHEFISKEWGKIIAGEKSYEGLRDKLVFRLKEVYPELTANLDLYLEQVDGAKSKTADKTPPGNFAQSPQMTCIQGVCSFDKENGRELKIFDLSENYKPNWDWGLVNEMASSTSISKITLPDVNDQTMLLYRSIYTVQPAVMLTHAFSLKKNVFEFYPEYEYRLSSTIPHKESILPHHFMLFLDRDELFGQAMGKEPVKIEPDYSPKKGMPQKTYESVRNKAQTSQVEANLDPQEKAAIYEYINELGYSSVWRIKGEGSNGDLMLDEFKKSFSAYQLWARRDEVNQIANIIADFKDIKEVDSTKLTSGQYQAISITTKFDSSSSHAESLLTDGRLLFWINRGGGSDESPGIKVFKITKDMREVIAALDWLKEDRSQTKTRAKIYSLLREDADNNVPAHIYIPMSGQTIGNCGWTQTEGMLRAAALVNRLIRTDILSEDLYQGATKDAVEKKIKLLIESQEWQKLLKDSEDIYKDFIRYDMVKRLEAVLLSMDGKFQPVFLDSEEQAEVNRRREVAGNHITHELLERLNRAVKEDHVRFNNEVYEQQVYRMLDISDVAIAMGSEMGKALQRVSGKHEAKNLFETYQKNRQNNFEQLSKIYKKIEEGKVQDKQVQDRSFAKILNDIIDKEPSLSDAFIEGLF